MNHQGRLEEFASVSNYDRGCGTMNVLARKCEARGMKPYISSIQCMYYLSKNAQALVNRS